MRRLRCGVRRPRELYLPRDEAARQDGGMRLHLFQIDAFATKVFEGNPAAVCPLDAWLDDATMQAIAAENNLSETAFFVCDGADPARYALRWFTPKTEVDLCGHATLASAFVLFELLGQPGRSVTFTTKSGALEVTRQPDGTFSMLFPALRPAPCNAEEASALALSLGRPPRESLRTKAFLAVYDSEADVVALAPDMARVAALDGYAVIATAPGTGGVDFVSRFFAPKVGVPEDPVTGSAHCTLAPYWSKRLGKASMRGVQRSARGGEVFVEDRGDKVVLAGRAVRYLEGHVEV
jgi:PhzF family phenazine biosynthesis protein